jgi:hypothetical protein
MVALPSNSRVFWADASRALGESRLEGQDPRSRAARASARHYFVQDERFALRTETFLDKEPSPTEVPAEVVAEVRANLTLLRQEWDRMYPENRISTERKAKRKGKSNE